MWGTLYFNVHSSGGILLSGQSFLYIFLTTLTVSSGLIESAFLLPPYFKIIPTSHGVSLECCLTKNLSSISKPLYSNSAIIFCSVKLHLCGKYSESFQLA